MLSSPIPWRPLQVPVFLACALAPGMQAAAETPQVTPEVSTEVRAVWVTRWDFKTETDVRRTVRWSAAVGLNRVFFQVRGRADAFYRSPLEPWGEELGGSDPGFDPLWVAIDEARIRGVELHAWVNLLPGWKGAKSPTDPRHILYTHPEWFLEDSHGKRLLKKPGGYTILNPCLPEVRNYLVGVMSDIVHRYPVNGLHLDYVRFIGRNPRVEGDVPYDPRSLSLFLKHSGGSPATAPEAWDDWRRRSVNTLVYKIQETVRRIRPGCRVTAAAIADYERARKALFQDVVTWQKHRWVDEVYPMIYTDDPKEFAQRSSLAMRAVPGSRVIPGIGVHTHSSARQTAQQIELTRRLGAGGYCLFAFTSLFPSASHEYRTDDSSRRLRASLRRTVLTLNNQPPPPTSPGQPAPVITRLANPPPSR